ncbi:MAG: SPOR domain-containing protein, partial [Salinisphaera sp.]|uniref:SPOR domain-containing protein n=1 Tax=Salinisphaera sp. TaxID=1914330 RepID=UPI003C7AA161
PPPRPARSKPKAAPRKKTGGGSGGNSGRGTPNIRSGAPGCIWLLCGILLGVAGLSVYYIASRPAGHGPESVSVDLPTGESTHSNDKNAQDAGHTSTTGSDETGTAGENRKKTNPRFSFYKMLPNYKVEVPAGQQQPAANDNEPHEAEPAANTPAPSTPSHTASHSNNTTPSSSSASAASNPGASGPGYVIQAGAFSAENDADHRKAQLALLGVTADIVDIQTSSGKTVYRVQSSVLKSSDTAHSLAQRLQSHGIETMVRQAD